MTLKEILDHWQEDRPRYETFSATVSSMLVDISKKHGIQTKVTHRVKDEVSLARKLLKKSVERNRISGELGGIIYSDYADMKDKVGLRIVCRFKDEISILAGSIRNEFEIVCEDDKIEHLYYNQMGYRSYHFDIKLKGELTEPETFSKIGDICGEIQLRTLCEDVWAEIDHDIGYKSSSTISDDIRRQIHCLGGLLEVTDDYVTGVKERLIQSSILDENVMIWLLEKPFIQHIRSEYDRELTLFNLNSLLPLVVNYPLDEFEDKFNGFCERNAAKIKSIFQSNQDRIRYIPYFWQPEVLLIFYLIEHDEFRLTELWMKNFDVNDLEEISIIWGFPLTDIIEER